MSKTPGGDFGLLHGGENLTTIEKVPRRPWFAWWGNATKA